MFPLYALLIGLVAGAALGGRLSGLGQLTFRWAPVAVIGLVAQVVLFSQPVADRVGAAGAPIYVASSAAVLAALLANLAVPGLKIVAVGAISNLAAIVANGGSMPASPQALAALGKHVGDAYSNSVADASPALRGLTDIYALPGWLPFANVFSIGDVLIGIGIGVAVCEGMRLAGGARRNRAPRNPPPVPMAHGPDAEPPIRSA